jgi:hypothetical protein
MNSPTLMLAAAVAALLAGIAAVLLVMQLASSVL